MAKGNIDRENERVVRDIKAVDWNNKDIKKSLDKATATILSWEDCEKEDCTKDNNRR